MNLAPGLGLDVKVAYCLDDSIVAPSDLLFRTSCGGKLYTLKCIFSYTLQLEFVLFILIYLFARGRANS